MTADEKKSRDDGTDYGGPRARPALDELPILAAFNQGAVPTIACINKATVDMGVDFDALVPALQKFLDECFVPIC